MPSRRSGVFLPWKSVPLLPCPGDVVGSEGPWATGWTFRGARGCNPPLLGRPPPKEVGGDDGAGPVPVSYSIGRGWEKAVAGGFLKTLIPNGSLLTPQPFVRVPVSVY